MSTLRVVPIHPVPLANNVQTASAWKILVPHPTARPIKRVVAAFVLERVQGSFVHKDSFAQTVNAFLISVQTCNANKVKPAKTAIAKSINVSKILVKMEGFARSIAALMIRVNLYNVRKTKAVKLDNVREKKSVKTISIVRVTGSACKESALPPVVIETVAPQGRSACKGSALPILAPTNNALRVNIVAQQTILASRIVRPVPLVKYASMANAKKTLVLVSLAKKVSVAKMGPVSPMLVCNQCPNSASSSAVAKQRRAKTIHAQASLAPQAKPAAMASV